MVLPCFTNLNLQNIRGFYREILLRSSPFLSIALRKSIRTLDTELQLDRDRLRLMIQQGVAWRGSQRA